MLPPSEPGGIAVFQALTAESCAAEVTEPLARPHFILAGKAQIIITTVEEVVSSH